MKRLYLLNPHLADFTGEPIIYKIFNKRPLKKYYYLNKALIKYNCDENISILVDPFLSSLVPNLIFALLPFWARNLVARFEVYVWAIINKEFKFRIFNLSQIDSNSVIFAFCFKTFHNGLNSYDKLLKSHKIILHLSHYFVRTKKISEFINRCGDRIVIAFDNSLINNKLYKKLVKNKKYRTIIIPFVCRDIFKYPSIEWNMRKTQIISSGTFHPIDLINKNKSYELFRESFPNKIFHNFRSHLYQKRNKLKSIDWKILCSPYKENNSYSNISSIFSRLWGNVGLQAKYFKINISDEYKSSKYSYVDPETAGSLSIGFIESAACGCIPIIPSSYLEGLPLEKGRDYIEIEEFDGNIDNYINQIYSATFKKLSLKPKEISQKYRTIFSEEALIKNTIKNLKDL